MDNDDLLYSTGDTYCCGYHNHFHGGNTKFHELTEFNLETRWGISKQQVWERERHYYQTSFYEEMKPIPGAYEGIDHLYKNDHNTHIITGRGKDVAHHTIRKLRQDFEPHHFRSINHTGPQFFNGEHEAKIVVCERLGIQLHFDDYLTTLIKCANKGIFGILFDKPWNQSTDLPKLIYRIENDNWQQAIDVFEEIKRKYTGQPIF